MGLQANQLKGDLETLEKDVLRVLGDFPSRPVVKDHVDRIRLSNQAMAEDIVEIVFRNGVKLQ